MKIISHRGLWREPSQKNTSDALYMAFKCGFGLETDVRDFNGKLVISHDLPDENSSTADDVFKILFSINPSLPLAVNIKADGLQDQLLNLLSDYPFEDYFLFDMSTPDMLASIRSELCLFTRQSDIEPSPVFYAEASGIWMDGFSSFDWLEEWNIETHLKSGKRVCIVSPELHGRRHFPFWSRLRQMPFLDDKNVMLCTDHPNLALSFFNHEQ